MSSFPFRNCRFQLTHPTRSATSFRALSSIAAVISTHAPHAECDGVRTSTALPSVFQLTHPTRSATLHCNCRISAYGISTHAPHAECDHFRFRRLVHFRNFNSRTPRGVRHCRRVIVLSAFGFQLTHPTRSATLFHATIQQQNSISTHAPHAECDDIGIVIWT